MMKIIPIQSINIPKMKTINITVAKAPHLPKGALIIVLTSTSPQPALVNIPTKEKARPPMRKTKELILSVSITVYLRSAQLNFLYARVKRTTAAQPTAAASVGGGYTKEDAPQNGQNERYWRDHRGKYQPHFLNERDSPLFSRNSGCQLRMDKASYCNIAAI